MKNFFRAIGISTIIFIITFLICMKACAQTVPMKCATMCFVTASVNGKPATFIVDTGAGFTVIDIAFAQREGINVSQRSEGIVGVTGKYAAIPIYPVIDIAGVRVKSKIVAADLSVIVNAAAEDGIEIAGILGGDFLTSRGAVIDYKNRKIIL